MGALAIAEPVAVTPKTGRPTDYKPEYCEQIIEFFLQDRKKKRVAVSSEVGGKDGWKKQYRIICGDLPSLKMFAFSIGVAPKTISEWQNRHPAFREACARAQSIGEHLLVERASNGLYNAQFAAFYAKNVYGWRDKIDIDSTTTTVDAGQTTLQALLSCATPDLLAQFRGLLDTMKLHAIASGKLTPEGQPIPQASLSLPEAP